MTLCLDSIIEPHPMDRRLQNTTDAFAELCQPWPLDALVTDPAFVEFLPSLHCAHRWFIQTVPPWHQEPVVSVPIFVDGSSYQNRNESLPSPAAWAFIVVLQCQLSDNDVGYRFFGAVSQMLATASQAPSTVPDVGELLTDLLTAEATGMTWVLVWLLQSQFTQHAFIHYDNTTVGGFTSGQPQWQETWEFSTLKRNLGALRHYLVAQGRSFECCHLKSHDQHPWSEAADALAKATALRTWIPGQLPMIVATALRSSHVEHAWTSLAHSVEMPSPSAFRATFSAEGPFHGHVPDVTWIHDEHHTQIESVTCQLTLATANVLTLHCGSKQSQDRGLYDLGRSASLQRQCSEAGILLLGLQAQLQSLCVPITSH